MRGGIIVLITVVAGFILFGMPVILHPDFIAYNGPFTSFDSAKALLLFAALSLIVALFLPRSAENGRFIVDLFLGALLVRLILAALIFSTNTQGFFGGDAYTYDILGLVVNNSWAGSSYDTAIILRFAGKGFTGSGWGMIYVAGSIYWMMGRNMFAVQLLNAVLGAATAPIIFYTAQTLFNHTKVSKIAALSVAFFPSLALWSSQGLKDGPIMFTLAAAMFATLKLGLKFEIKFFVLLAVSLLGLLTLRFYVFYMAVAAIVISFTIGMNKLSAQSFLRQLVVVAGLGVAFASFGVSRLASAQLEQYGSFEKVQISRQDMATAGESGFGKGADVTSSEGALTILPLGMAYLLLAPFPWQMASLRSLITLPEMIVWWCSIPLLLLGLWYAIKHRARKVSPILIFVSMLTIAYSVTQGNVGTAYRQRSQLLIFYLIFAAVGFVLQRERKEINRLAKNQHR